MKNLNKTKSLFLVLGLACITSFFITCKSPVENILVTVSADYVTAANEFRVFDATTGNSETAFEGVSVKITGAAEASAYSSGGSKTITINNGIIQVCFRKGTVASETNPLKFNIEVKVSGYLPKVYPVKLTSINPVVESIFLVNTNNLPKGSAKISATTTTDNNGTTTSETIVTLPTNANKTEVAELTIPTGVTMKDKDGNPVTGTLAIDVLQFAGNGQQAMDAFGNKGDNTIKDINGNTLTETVIAPLGWLNINITAGGKEVKTFSSPVKGKIGIPAGLVNPITGAEYKEGDAISVLSKEDDGTEFKKEANTTLQKATDGSLFVEINISHLSTWTIAQLLQMCSMKFEFPVNTAADKLTEFEVAMYDFKYSFYKSNGDLWYEIRDDYYEQKKSELDKYTYSQDKFTAIIPIENLAPVKFSFNSVGLFFETSIEDKKNGYNKRQVYSFYDIASNKVNNPCSASAIVSGPSTAKSNTRGKFRAKCTSGSSNYVVLPEGFKLYYVKESDYNSNGNPVLSNAIWKNTTLSVENEYNIINVNKTDFAGGGAYRFAVLYDGKRYDYIYTVANPVPDDISIELSIPCK
jgi:hypothetical protein